MTLERPGRLPAAIFVVLRFEGVSDDAPESIKGEFRCALFSIDSTLELPF